MSRRNVRWGPCPHCGADGWDTVAQRRSNLFDHDRPGGGRCRVAAEQYEAGKRWNHRGEVVQPDADGRCGTCGFANFTYGEHAADGTRGYRCNGCGNIKPEKRAS